MLKKQPHVPPIKQINLYDQPIYISRLLVFWLPVIHLVPHLQCPLSENPVFEKKDKNNTLKGNF